MTVGMGGHAGGMRTLPLGGWIALLVGLGALAAVGYALARLFLHSGY